MNKLYKKMISFVLAFLICASSMNYDNIFAQENDIYIKKGVDSSFEYNGTDNVYLGQFGTDYRNVIDYREYDTYQVYDYGITKQWCWQSRPFFIRSVPKGGIHEETYTVSTTIEAKINGDISSEAKAYAFNSFNIRISGTKSFSEKIVLAGPEPGSKSRSRDYYYCKGAHRHAVKVVQEHKSNWDGVLWTKEYYVDIDVPAIKCYSEDT